jgi:nucleoside-diphosphate-sugar epimerase
MRILITGNLGYIGTELSTHLLNHGMSVFGLDSGFYKDCLLVADHKDIPTKIKDIRDVSVEDFKGYDAVVHLAALSNDPIGELDSALTFKINRDASIKAAELAREALVKRFLFVSTQSIYGISTIEDELDESAIKNPQTAYAKSKWDAEQVILRMSTVNYTTVSLRPSTVFGWSPRLRSDIVFNNLLLSGWSKGKLEVHSDGTPWRPIVHVSDLAEAIRLTLIADKKVVSANSFNIGKIGGNYTVKEIASAAKKCIGDIEIIFNTENIVDPRSYKVSFKKAFNALGFEAKRELVESGIEILNKLKQHNVEASDSMGRLTNRLGKVSHLRQEGKVDESLRFI